MPTQTPNTDADRLVELLPGLDAEKRTDHDGAPYVSVPIGHMEAVEIEIEPGDDRQPDARTYTVWCRSWEANHGMLSDELHGTFSFLTDVALFVNAFIAELAAQAAQA